MPARLPWEPVLVTEPPRQPWPLSPIEESSSVISASKARTEAFCPIMRLLLIFALGLILGSSFLGCLGTPEEEDHLDLWIGQMLMVGFRGTDLKEGDPFLQALRDLHLGGVVLFDRDVPTRSPLRNIVSPQQVQELTAQLQAVAEVPLLIAIDQEGGQIARLKARHGFSPPPPRPSWADGMIRNGLDPVPEK